MAEMKVMTLENFQYFVQQKLDPIVDGKVDKVAGKGLSTNDFTDSYKNTIDGLVSSGGQANIIEVVKVNGSALTPDSDKAVNIDLSAYALKSDIVNAMDWMGTKATYAELPASGNSKGDIWHVTENSAEYAWDGTEWQELGSIVDLSDYYNKSEVDGLVSPKADKSYVDTELAKKANSSHSHAISDVTGLQTALDAKLNSADLIAITNAEIDALFA